MQLLASFNSKLFKPCRRLLKLLSPPYKRPISIRAFKFRNLRKVRREKKDRYQRKKFRSLLSVFWPSRRSTKEMDKIGELKSFTDGNRVPFPSPLTPAFIKLAGVRRMEEGQGGDDVEEACRSFENYLVEMIVEEGKVRDLTDVEELLYCWNSLKSPVFVDLVCRFYGELCKDLFSGSSEYEVVVDDTTCDYV